MGCAAPLVIRDGLGVEHAAAPSRAYHGRFDYRAAPQWRGSVRVFEVDAERERELIAHDSCNDAWRVPPRVGYDCVVRFDGVFSRKARALRIVTGATSDVVGEIELDVR